MMLTTFQTVMRGTFLRTGTANDRPGEWMIVSRDGALLSVTLTGVLDQGGSTPCPGGLGRKATLVAELSRVDNAGEHFSLLASLPSGEHTEGAFCAASGQITLAVDAITGELRLKTTGMTAVKNRPSSDIPALYDLGLLSFGPSLPGDIDARLYPTTWRALA